MARNRRSSILEDLADFATRLPVWLSLTIALISYVVLHHFASQPVTPQSQPGSLLPTNMYSILFRPLLLVVQYLVPFGFVLGAVAAALKARSGRRLATEYRSSATTKSVDFAKDTGATANMSWQQFELLVGEAFRQAGYRVIDGGDTGPDGGVDVHLKKDGQTFFVQCKHWKARSVGVPVVRELYGVIAAAGARGGFVVTSGDFTQDAKDFARGTRIHLIDGKKLDTMLRGAARSLTEEVLAPPATAANASACPRCASPMVRRKARQGPNAGQEFWGCSQYPKCRGIRPLK